jgi:fructokinase
MLPRCHLLKVSEEDLQQLMPGIAPEAFAAEAIAHGVGLVVITRGAAGALGVTRAGPAAASPLPVEVIDTVGAGDTFQAALLTWLAEHDALAAPRVAGLSTGELTSALAFATRATAITCSRRGADMPRRAELPN